MRDEGELLGDIPLPMALLLSSPLPPGSPITLSYYHCGMFPPLWTETSCGLIPLGDYSSRPHIFFSHPPILDPELIQVPEIQAPRSSQGFG